MDVGVLAGAAAVGSGGEAACRAIAANNPVTATADTHPRIRICTPLLTLGHSFNSGTVFMKRSARM